MIVIMGVTEIAFDRVILKVAKNTLDDGMSQNKT